MQFNNCWGNSLPMLYLKRFCTFLFVILAGPLVLALGAAVIALYLALLFPVMIPACVPPPSSPTLPVCTHALTHQLMLACRYVWGRKHYSSWAYSYGDFFAHSVKKMIQVQSQPLRCTQASNVAALQVFGIMILAPPTLALAIALFPFTFLILRRVWADDD
jgi:hypothetical protein